MAVFVLYLNPLILNAVGSDSRVIYIIDCAYNTRIQMANRTRFSQCIVKQIYHGAYSCENLYKYILDNSRGNSPGNLKKIFTYGNLKIGQQFF